jgi:hypothetical protein
MSANSGIQEKDNFFTNLTVLRLVAQSLISKRADIDIANIGTAIINEFAIDGGSLTIFYHEATDELVFQFFSKSANMFRYSRLPMNMGPPLIGFTDTGPCVRTLNLQTVPTQLANMLALRPIKGVNYQPSPSDWTTVAAPPQYFDGDFWNSDFEGLWGSTLVPGGASPCVSSAGRNDLQTLHEDLSTNLIRGFNLSLQFRNHVPFLDACEAVNIKVLLPLDTWVLAVDGPSWTTLKPLVIDVIQQLGPHPSVAGWTLGNELNSISNADRIATMFQLLVQYDTMKRPVTSPLQLGFFPSMAEDIKQAIMNKGLLQDYTNRWFISMNIYPPSNDVVGGALDNLEQIINNTWPQSSFANDLFLVTEYGVSVDFTPSMVPITETEQADSIKAQAQWIQNAANNVNLPNFLGGCVFEWSNELWKSNVSPAQGTLGLNKFAVSPMPPADYCTAEESNSLIYRVDNLINKPSYASYKSVVKP